MPVPSSPVLCLCLQLLLQAMHEGAGESLSSLHLHNGTWASSDTTQSLCGKCSSALSRGMCCS